MRTSHKMSWTSAKAIPEPRGCITSHIATGHRQRTSALPRHQVGRPPSLPHNHPASHPSWRCERLARCRRCVGACPAVGHLPVSSEWNSAALRLTKSIDLFVLLAFRFSSAVTCAQPLAAMPARGLREIFSTRTRTLAEKFSRPRGGTPAPSCRRDSPLPAGQKNWRPPSRGTPPDQRRPKSYGRTSEDHGRQERSATRAGRRTAREHHREGRPAHRHRRMGRLPDRSSSVPRVQLQQRDVDFLAGAGREPGRRIPQVARTRTPGPQGRKVDQDFRLLDQEDHRNRHRDRRGNHSPSSTVPDPVRVRHRPNRPDRRAPRSSSRDHHHPTARRRPRRHLHPPRTGDDGTDGPSPASTSPEKRTAAPASTDHAASSSTTRSATPKPRKR